MYNVGWAVGKDLHKCAYVHARTVHVYDEHMQTYTYVHMYVHTSTPNASKMCVYVRMYVCTFGVTGTVSTYRGSKWVFFISRVPYTHTKPQGV